MKKQYREKWTLYSIIVAVTFCLHVNSSFGNECRNILTETTVGLENSKIALEFDRNSGTLVRIFNVETNGEYFKTSATKGNTFRIYANTTKKPSFIESGSAQPDEEQLGGKVVDPLDCKMINYHFYETDEGLSLILVSHSESSDLCFEVKISIQSADPSAKMQLTVKNISKKTMKIMTAFPYISGIGLWQGLEHKSRCRTARFRPLARNGLARQRRHLWKTLVLVNGTPVMNLRLRKHLALWLKIRI